MAAARVASVARSVATKLTYPVRPPPGFQNGRVVTPTHWNKIGGIFPREPFAGELSKLHDEEDTRHIDVLDARDAPAPPSLAENGFELRTRPTGVKNFYDDDEVRGAYYPEVAALVKAATGARDAVVFQHMRRDSDALNKEGAGARNAATAGAHGAVQRVHADYTPSNAPVKLRDLEAAGAVAPGAADGRRWSFVNVWRSIDDGAPVRALPLAVLDASTVRADEMFTYALVLEEAEPPLVGYNNGVGYSEHHDWYYYSAMTSDEALLFYTYDGASAPPRFVFHTAFADPTTPPDAPPRKSIECRCLALF